MLFMEHFSVLEDIKLLSPDEVAKELGLTVQHVTRLCRGGVFGRKVGKCWVIFEQEVQAYKEKPKNGRGKYDREKKE